jgi:ribosomal protein L11 methyltransferase
MKWIEITVTTSPQAVEAIANILLECRTGGIAEELLQPGLVRLRGYLPVGPATEVTLAAIERRIRGLPKFDLDISPGTMTTEVIEDENWAVAWKTHYKPFGVGRRLWIKPTWDPEVPSGESIIIELDPGMAFGSGLHPSTQLCLQVLEQHLRAEETVFDVGTGSGILAIAAAKLGAGAVVAIDEDPIAVEVARKNVVYNNVADRVTVQEGNLLADIRGRADLIVANLTADILFRFVPDAGQHLAPGGLLLASGIIADRLLEVQAVATASGFQILKMRPEGEWRCLLLTPSAIPSPSRPKP